MIRFRWTLLLAGSLILAACATFTPPLPADRGPDPAAGYIYGRFTLLDTSTGIGHLRTGLGISGAQEHTIQFSQGKGVAVIAVPPGSYSISKLVFATYDYEKAGEKPIADARLSARFSVESGKAYYIGDYVAESVARFTGLQAVQSWRLSSIRDAYESTTNQFNAEFPLFQGLETRRARVLEVQYPNSPGVAQCTPGMNAKACEEAQIDALSKKLDQASAVTAALDARMRNTPIYKYMAAIQSAVMRNWRHPDGMPNEHCVVHVRQLPGGKVLSAAVDPSCPYDEAARRSVVNAVLRTAVLPYEGFEGVFQQNLNLIFSP